MLSTCKTAEAKWSLVDGEVWALSASWGVWTNRAMAMIGS